WQSDRRRRHTLHGAPPSTLHHKNEHRHLTVPRRATGEKPHMSYRREFLKFLAASPLLGTYDAFAQAVEETLGRRLKDPSEVINVFEMEAVARSKVPPAHFGYLISGVDSDGTLRANEAGFTRYQIRPR